MTVSETELRPAYYRAHSIIMTRSIGWAQPSPCILPLADMFNYSNDWTCMHFIVHRQHELQPGSAPKEYNVKHNQLDLRLIDSSLP